MRYFSESHNTLLINERFSKKMSHQVRHFFSQQIMGIHTVQRTRNDLYSATGKQHMMKTSSVSKDTMRSSILSKLALVVFQPRRVNHLMTLFPINKT